MAITIQCPNPACRARAAVAAGVSGRDVKCKRCGTAFVAQPTVVADPADTQANRPAAAVGDPFPTLPAEFGRYRVLQLLGKGGMGAVYLAEDSQLGRQVALKLPSFAAGASDERVERFLREARSAAALHHPNICTLYDAGREGDRPYLTMAYLEGRSLADAIDPDRPMAQREAAGLARKVAAALGHAHERGIVHRDLKPANIMLSAAGEPVVMDFGLAKRLAEEDTGEAKLTRDGAVMGTPDYMAPEQVRGETDRIGPPTDVYALGVLLFELLTGRPPYEGHVGAVLGQILAAPVPSARELRPDIDERLEAICRRAMAKEPGARFPSMAAFAEALGQYLASARQAAPAASKGPEPFRDLTEPAPRRRPRARAAGRPSRRPLLIGAGAAGLVLLLAALGVVLLTVRTKHGDVVVELSDPAAPVEVKVDGEKIELAGPDRPLSLTVGEHGLTVTGADYETITQAFTVKKGEKRVVKVTLTPKPVVGGRPGKPPPPVPEPRTSTASPPAYLARKPGEIWRSPESTAKILWCDFSPAGNYVVVARDNQQVQLWPISETQNGQQSFTLRHPVENQLPLVTGVNFSPDGRWLATGARDGSIVLWSLASTPPNQVVRIKAFDGIVTPLAFSPSGQLLAAGVRKPGGGVCIWNLADPTNPGLVRSFAADDPVQVSSMVFSNDSTTLYVGGGGPDTGPRVYAAPVNDPTSRLREIWAWSDGKAGQWPRGRLGHWPRSIQVSRDGKELGFAAEDKAYILNLATNQVRLKFDGHQPDQPVVGFAFSPDGTRCLTAGYDKTVRLWSASTGIELWRNDKPMGYNEGVSFSPDGRLAFTGCQGNLPSENLAQLWRLPDPEPAVRETPLTEDWVSLFNGKDLTGWTVAKGEARQWSVKDGDLIGVAEGNAKDQWLLTDKDYDNFVLRFEYQLRQPAKASSGITFRALPADPLLPIKLMDDSDRSDWAVKNGERTGCLWTQGRSRLDMASPKRNARLKPAGEWNEVELTLNGKVLTLTINGEEVQNLDLSEFPTLTRASGRIGLQSHTSIVRFRNIRVKELPGPGAKAVPGKAEVPSIVGRWLNDREVASTHEFLPDGRYRYVRQGRTSEGRWSREGDQVSFEWTDSTTKESNKRSLRIVSAEGSTITVLVEGERPYTWKKLD